MVWRRETNKDTSMSIGTQGYKGQTCVCKNICSISGFI